MTRLPLDEALRASTQTSARGGEEAYHALRESGERQAFLLRLSDLLRGQPNADEVATTALTLLAKAMRLDRCYVVAINPAEDRGEVTQQFRRPDLPPLPSVLRLSDFPAAWSAIFDGTLVLSDVAADSSMSELDKRNIATLGVGALVAGTLRRGGQTPIWALIAVSAQPRCWTASEVALVEEVAERTWAAIEQARAEEALRASEEKYRTLFTSIDEGFCTIEVLFDGQGEAVDYRFLETNPAFVRQTGLDNAVGRTVCELLPQHEHFWTELYGHVARTGEPVRVEHEAAGLGKFYGVSAFRIGTPGEHRVAVLFTDISERKRAEAALNWRARRDELLSDTAARLLQSEDPQGLVEDLCRRVMVFLDCHAFFNFLVDEPTGRLHLNACAGIPEAEARRLEWLNYGAAVCGSVARDRQRIVAEDIPHATDPRTDLVKSYGIQAYCCHPLLVQGRLMGTLSFGTRARPRFSPDEIAVMQAVASLVAIAMHRIETERALRISKERLRLFIEYAPAGIAMFDREMRYLGASRRWRSDYRLPEDVVGRSHYALFPDLPEHWKAAHRRGLAGELIAAEEDAFERPDGSVQWITWEVRPWYQMDGAIGGILIGAEDITERKQAELALRDSQQQLALALEAGQLGFWDWDVPSGRVQFSDRWAAMLGYDPDEIEPHIQAWERLVYPDEKAAVMATLSGHLAGRTDFYECEHRMRHKDGSWRWILDRGRVVARDAAGRPLRAVGTHADVTARREAENALQDADRRKDEFLAMLAHELRNPLAPIRNALHVLKKTEDESPAARERARRLLSMVERQVKHLVRLVDDLLEVSRITRGKIELRKEPVDLAAVVAQAVETSQPLIRANGHELTVSLPPEPLPLEADPVRLCQVFANLLNNAAKYTPPGGRIEVAAERQGDGVAVAVRDTGEGIPAEMLPRIFDLFTQVDRSIDRAQGGLGIGLSLVHRLVTMHGGRVEARSEGLGQGSEFLVHLPLAVVVPADATRADAGLLKSPPHSRGGR